MAKKKNGGAFDEFFAKVYGADRWPTLGAALRAEPKKIARVNPFAPKPVGEFASFLGERFQHESHYGQPAALSGSELETFYFMEFASLLPPLVLDVQPGHNVLDMCAAPGGKTLVLAHAAALPEPEKFLQTHFVANEISVPRRSRLLRVLKEQLPQEIFSHIRVTNHDASKWSLYQKDFYDKILLDAPCSGERAWINDKKLVAEWTPKRSKNMGVRQYAILAAAFGALKPGGEVVYSTCSLSPLENDAVVAKLLKREPERAELVELKMNPELATQTEMGWIALPDRGGSGPIYFSKIKRLS